MSNALPPLADHLASLRDDTAGGPIGGWLPAPLHALILAALARVFGRLEQLLRLWQTGALPAPRPRAPTASATPRAPQARARQTRIRHSRTRLAIARRGKPVMPRPGPPASSTRSRPSARPHRQPRPARAPPSARRALFRSRKRALILFRYCNI